MDKTLETIREHMGALLGSELFAGISAGAALEFLALQRPRLRALEAGETVVEEGEAVGDIGLVLLGALHGGSLDADGRQSLIARIGAGHAFGEVLACTGGHASPVTVFAAEPSLVLLLDYKRLIAPGADSPTRSAVTANLLRMVGLQFFALHEKIGYLTRRTLRERISAYLANESRRSGARSFTVPLDREGMAEYLGADRSALSRELSAMRRDGLIDYKKNAFTLK